MFAPPDAVARATKNASQYPWAAEQRRRTIDAAAPWLERSDEDLWSLMFGPKLPRSWHVWSDGHCPVCAEPVPMYEWKIDALNHPWKVQCPRCQRRFPGNDFHAYHESGLDARGLFDPQRADRALLTADDDTLLIDDGDGAVVGDRRWRFIATYLVYGQWKQLIVAGINRLAEAYVTTGDRRYAHKTLVMLDRVADVYPEFDFITQAWMYDGPARETNCNGFVSTWHDACEETRELTLSYGYVRDALDDDDELVAFLVQRSQAFDTSVAKTTAADIHRNILCRGVGAP